MVMYVELVRSRVAERDRLLRRMIFRMREEDLWCWSLRYQRMAQQLKDLVIC